MSRNKLKVIACLTMLIDHIGYLLFPNLAVLRFIGRISMPLFAFFIAEGCLHTRSKIKYFLRILLLAVFCQAIYLILDISSGKINRVSLNILFTFALSAVICFAFLKFKSSLTEHSEKRAFPRLLLFLSLVALSYWLCTRLSSVLPVPVYFDYGFAGVILPMFALICDRKEAQLALFYIGLIVFNIMLSSQLSYTWFSLLSIPLLMLYNGKAGTHRLKYAFYLFYPIHFAVLYLIKLMMSS